METKYKVILAIIYVIGVVIVYGILYFIALGEGTYDEDAFWKMECSNKISFKQKAGIFLISLSSWLFFVGCLAIECFEKIKISFVSLTLKNK